jgi:hypothetical protein
MPYRLNLGPVGRGIEHGGAARVRATGAPGLAHADVRRRLTWAVLRLATRTAPEDGDGHGPTVSALRHRTPSVVAGVQAFRPLPHRRRTRSLNVEPSQSSARGSINSAGHPHGVRPRLPVCPSWSPEVDLLPNKQGGALRLAGGSNRPATYHGIASATGGNQWQQNGPNYAGLAAST